MNKTEQIHKQILKENVVNTNDLKTISKKILGKKNLSMLKERMEKGEFVDFDQDE